MLAMKKLLDNGAAWNRLRRGSIGLVERSTIYIFFFSDRSLSSAGFRNTVKVKFIREGQEPEGMKHSLRITLLLVGLFLVTQLVGLATLSKYLNVTTVMDEGQIQTVVEYDATVIGDPIQVEHKSLSGFYILLGVLLGTGLIFLLIRFKAGALWKYWFLLSVVITLAVAFGVYVNAWIAGILAAVLAWWKVYRPNVVVHNLTEIFIYTGIAVIFVPIFTVTSVFILLVLISLYDMFAVWKSKHMVKLAVFQAKSNMFAGLMIPYHDGHRSMGRPGRGQKKENKDALVKAPGKEERTAILGGGDIAFPLLFAGVAMADIIHLHNLAKPVALALSSVIPVTTTLALFGLLYAAKKDRFYPAMPFISIGCFVGYGILQLLI